MTLVRAHLYICGRVQGVCYRSYAEEEASRLGLKGWVKNLNDGRVELVCEGTKDNVEQLIESCRKGPPGALVADIKINWETATGEFNGFGIEYGY